MERRALLKLAGLSAVAALGCDGTPANVPQEKEPAMPAPEASENNMPVVFIAHGSPFLTDDAAWMGELAAWARALPRPQAILMISAHWTVNPVTLGATTTLPLVYDFYNFPKKYYDITYAAPGAPKLAQRVSELLSPSQPLVSDPRRGLDHGAYIPLIPMYPDASVPVLQMSIPTMEAAPLIALGQSLSALRREGVLIVGSGFLTHNLRALDFEPHAKPQSWAQEFDAWCEDVLLRKDVDALVQYRTLAPGVRQSLPTHEHFVPVLTALGAALDGPHHVTFPIGGFAYGSMTRRSVQFG